MTADKINDIAIKLISDTIVDSYEMLDDKYDRMRVMVLGEVNGIINLVEALKKEADTE